MNNVGTCGATRAIEARGLRLTAWEWGARERPVMLLLHSLAAHSHWWDGMAALLEDTFHIVALDFRGHGHSGHAMPPAYHFADYVADFVAALDVLGWRAPAGILRHLAETGIVERDGAFTFAFDRHVFLHPPLDPWSFLSRIRCPALVIRGESSVVMPREAGERVTAVLQQGSFVEVKDAWHHVILDDPAAFADAVSRWLADIQKGDLR